MEETTNSPNASCSHNAVPSQTHHDMKMSIGQLDDRACSHAVQFLVMVVMDWEHLLHRSPRPIPTSSRLAVKVARKGNARSWRCMAVAGGIAAPAGVQVIRALQGGDGQAEWASGWPGCIVWPECVGRGESVGCDVLPTPTPRLPGRALECAAAARRKSRNSWIPAPLCLILDTRGFMTESAGVIPSLVLSLHDLLPPLPA
jgi:hypothetical protein